MLPGRSLDPGSNAGARGMITLPRSLLGRQNSAYRPASAFSPPSLKPFRKELHPMSIYEFEGKRPKIGETSFVHPAAVLIGGVTIGENCYIGPGAVLRGDFGYVEVGDGSNIQENCVIHTYPEQTARLGQDSHIGHGAIVHGSKIKENVLVGMGAILHEGVEIGDNCIIGSGCVITANQIIPAGKLVLGVPGKIVGDVPPEMNQAKVFGTKLYQTLPRRYKATLKMVG